MSTTTKPLLRYFGGKAEMAPWIVSLFPDHHLYLEPYGGAASVLFSKAPSPIEVYNDLYGEVFDFFQVLREQPEALIRKLSLTPWHRVEFNAAHEPSDDPVERARRFYVRSWQGFGGVGTGKSRRQRTGWRRSRTRPPQGSYADVPTLEAAAARLLSVQFESRPATDVMAEFDAPGHLFYVDPPYLLSVRGRTFPSELYHHDMTEDDHVELLDQLVGLDASVVLSGYRSDLYEDTLTDWTMLVRPSVKVNGSRGEEAVWLSPSIVDQHPQLTMFRGLA